MLNLGQVVLRRPVVGQQRAKADIHADRDRDNGQRDQKKLNGQGGRGDQRVSSRGFALDEFVHVWGIRRAFPERPKLCKFYYVCPLAVKRRVG